MIQLLFNSIVKTIMAICDKFQEIFVAYICAVSLLSIIGLLVTVTNYSAQKFELVKLERGLSELESKIEVREHEVDVILEDIEMTKHLEAEILQDIDLEKKILLGPKLDEIKKDQIRTNKISKVDILENSSNHAEENKFDLDIQDTSISNFTNHEYCDKTFDLTFDCDLGVDNFNPGICIQRGCCYQELSNFNSSKIFHCHYPSFFLESSGHFKTPVKLIKLSQTNLELKILIDQSGLVESLIHIPMVNQTDSKLITVIVQNGTEMFISPVNFRLSDNRTPKIQTKIRKISILGLIRSSIRKVLINNSIWTKFDYKYELGSLILDNLDLLIRRTVHIEWF